MRDLGRGQERLERCLKGFRPGVYQNDSERLKRLVSGGTIKALESFR